MDVRQMPDPTGPEPDLEELRRQAIEDGRRPVVGAIVRNHEGKVFVHRRGPDRVFLPDGWDVLGGHVEQGESLLGALAREIEEESGWKLTGRSELIYTVDWETNEDGSPNRRREFDFLVEVAGDLEHPRIERPQHTAHLWIGRDDIHLLDENDGRDFGIVRHIVELGLDAPRR
jgi:8-oxo-dGTP pyrophosphatase MutT (NUDIX family)